MSFLSSVKSFFAPQKIADREGLRQFIESRAAYLVQKSITEYTQARANMLFSTMMRESVFVEGYERARWLSCPAGLSMVTEMVEGTIREAEGTFPGALDHGLMQLVRDIIAPYPVASGQGEAFWRDASDRIARDLARAALGPPKPVGNIPYLRAREIFDVLPVATQLRKHDFAMFQNTIRFHLTEIKVEFEERTVPKSLAFALRP
jgi:hypothetical protein